MRLVVVSNRVVMGESNERAGGMAVALLDALSENGGLWFGWSGKIHRGRPGPPTVVEHGAITGVTLDLSRDEHERYYLNHSNRCLWPLLHYRNDLSDYSREDEAAYLATNERFAEALAPLLRADDVIWVHDYHLFPFARALRGRGVRNRIGFFLHVPFPPSEVFHTLPGSRRLAADLACYDVIGLQTHVSRRHMCNYLADSLGGTIEGDRVSTPAGSPVVIAQPVGIDVGLFARLATEGEGALEHDRMRSALRDRIQLIGVDRLDYTKGLVRRMRAFERLLEIEPSAHRRFEFLQIAPLSREDVEAYRRFRTEVEQYAIRINGRFGDADWTPVRYLNRALSRATLAGLYRASRIGLVTPMRDGMNLVAKEYVAAQDPDDPGVLVLSRFAGAAERMTAAVIVNPYDVDEVAEAVRRAADMPLDERRARHAELIEGLHAADADGWRRGFVARLRG